MTADELLSASIALLHSALGWQSRIARVLGVNRRTIARWLTAGATPSWVDDKFAELTGLSQGPGFWPRDEWIIGGDPSDRRLYVVHTRRPRFIARVVETDEDGLALPGQRPADLLGGVVYADGDDLLCEIHWIDDPDPARLTALLEAACDALDEAAEVPSVEP